MPKYIAYCRKSTDEKDRQVLSIEAQVTELKEFASRERLAISEFLIESKTAKSPGRPLFAQLVRRIESGEIQGIVSWHPDRLARNSMDGGKIIYLLDTGALLDLKFPSFWFDNTPQGKFMLGMAFNQSKYYVDNLSENVKRGLRQKLRNGIYPKQAPLGYFNEPRKKTIEIDPVTAPLVKKAFEMFSEGGVSITQIAKSLFELGMKSKSGECLHINQIKNMLTSSFYIGIFKFNGELHHGVHQCFIDKSLFDKVQKVMKRMEKPRANNLNFVFSGLARCGECGATITAEQHPKFYKQTNRRVVYKYYRCTKRLASCTQHYITESSLEAQLRHAIRDVGIDEEMAVEWRKLAEQDAAFEKSSAFSSLEALNKELSLIDEKSDTLLNGFIDGLIDSESYKRKKNEFFEKKIKLMEEKAKVEAGEVNWFEPLLEIINDAANAAKIACAKNNCSDLTIIAKKVGSNYLIENRQLTITLKKPFNLLCAPPPAQRKNRASLLAGVE